MDFFQDAYKINTSEYNCRKSSFDILGIVSFFVVFWLNIEANLNFEVIYRNGYIMLKI